MLQRGDKLTGLAVGEYRLELLLPQFLQTGQVNGLALGFTTVDYTLEEASSSSRMTAP